MQTLEILLTDDRVLHFIIRKTCFIISFISLKGRRLAQAVQQRREGGWAVPLRRRGHWCYCTRQPLPAQHAGVPTTLVIPILHTRGCRWHSPTCLADRQTITWALRPGKQCHPLLPPSIFPSISVFSNESVLHIRWPKYESFSFSISPSNGYSGLVSFRMDWFDLAVQGTLKSLLQHHSSKASILQPSAFFTVQLSYPYMTTGKTIALTRQTLVLQSQIGRAHV